MEINQKVLVDLAAQLGLHSAQRSASRAARMAGQFEGKSEDQLLREIMALKEEMRANPKMYQKQMQALRSLRNMMKGEQRRRLERILELLE